MKNAIARFMKDESGLGTVELVLLILILAGIAILFKDKLYKFFTSLTSRMNAANFDTEIPKN